jgi:hypothetical protein
MYLEPPSANHVQKPMVTIGLLICAQLVGCIRYRSGSPVNPRCWVWTCRLAKLCSKANQLWTKSKPGKSFLRTWLWNCCLLESGIITCSTVTRHRCIVLSSITLCHETNLRISLTRSQKKSCSPNMCLPFDSVKLASRPYLVS